MCSSVLAPDVQWSMLESLGASDHYLIIVTITGTEQPSSIPIWSINRAEWEAYRRSTAWENMLDITEINDEDIISDLYNRLNEASRQSIPSFTPLKFYPKPLWTDKCDQSWQ